MADLRTRLSNCAAWHMEQMDRAERNGDAVAAERHDMIAFRLFRRAHETPRGVM